MAEWWEEEGAVEDVDLTPEGAAVPTEWWEEEGAVADIDEMERTPFPMEPGTSRAAQELPELTNVSALLEGREQGAAPAELEALGLGDVERAVSGAGEELSQTWLNMTTLDPNELAQQISTRFPDVGVQWAPDGTVVIANNKTGKKVAVNRPGMSPMDVMQAIGLIGAFSPGAKLVGAVKGLGKKIVTGMGTSGATQTALEVGQAEAGGEFDTGEIALATAFGAAGELAVPVVTKAFYTLKGAGGKLEDLIPKSISQALEYANKAGAKITTSDALQEFLTPPMQILVKVAERIPFIGLGGMRAKQVAARADALSKLAKDYDIKLDSELGEEIIESFIERMKKRRFWGKNKEPTQEMLDRAFAKEGDEITDTLLSRYIRKGDLDDDVVDKVFTSGRTTRVKQMVNKLTPEGQQAAKQRFIVKALDEAGWTPEGPQFAKPEKFMRFLDKPQNRKTMGVMFEPDELAKIKGIREFIRLTNEAAQTGKGAGMTAAMATGTGFYLMDMMSAGLLGAGTAATSHIMQSAPVRNTLLRLAHAKVSKEAVKRAVDTLRPAFIAHGEQLLQQHQGNIPRPEFEITPEMVKQQDDDYERILEYLRGLGETATEAGGTITDTLTGMMRGLNQGSPHQRIFDPETQEGP